MATALSKEIKDFIEDEAPLMMLMSSPGIKKRHWDQIVKTTSISLPYEQDFVLRDLLDAGLQNFCAEIEEVRVACTTRNNFSECQVLKTFSTFNAFPPTALENLPSQQSFMCLR